LENAFGLVNLYTVFEDTLILPVDALSSLFFEFAFEVAGVDFLLFAGVLMGGDFPGVDDIFDVVGLVLKFDEGLDG
jgi:hypothetical protein